MRNIKRIAVIGNAGSGKSTLALELHKRLHLPLYHLDKYFWKPRWVPPDPAEYKVIHDALCDQDTWIMDGVNLRLLEHRINKAEVVIFLDLPRRVCLWRILKRTIRYYGKQSPTGAEQCQEKINWQFLKFLKWVWCFPTHYRPAITTLLRDYSKLKEMYVLKSQKDINQLLRRFS